MQLINIFSLQNPLTYVLIALVLGLILGLERTLAHKGAGMRTYGLVAMGACLFVTLAHIVAPTADPGSPGPMYVLQGLIMGIGFIGGGTILRNHDGHNNEHASGLTTAAGLWVAAGIGAAVGYGLLQLAVFVTLLTLVVFTLLWFLEHKLVGGKQ